MWTLTCTNLSPEYPVIPYRSLVAGCSRHLLLPPTQFFEVQWAQLSVSPCCSIIPEAISEQYIIALFTTQMFKTLHVQWACTLIGGVGILMMPIPFVFYKFGAKIRERSKFAPCEVSCTDRVCLLAVSNLWFVLFRISRSETLWRKRRGRRGRTGRKNC